MMSLNKEGAIDGVSFDQQAQRGSSSALVSGYENKVWLN